MSRLLIEQRPRPPPSCSRGAEQERRNEMRHLFSERVLTVEDRPFSYTPSQLIAVTGHPPFSADCSAKRGRYLSVLPFCPGTRIA